MNHQPDRPTETSAPRPEPGIPLHTARDMEVCHDCAAVVGPFDDRDGVRRVQRGRCPKHARPAGEPSWPRWDFDLYVELCRACGRVPLRSGSRWAVWFCPACSRQAGLLNGRHGRCILPIGRHSVHAGYLLKGEDARDPIAVHLFAEAMNGVFQVHGILETWARAAVRSNLEALGVEPGASVPLAWYWSRVRGSIDAGGRFREMCAFLEQAGRDAQGRAAR